MAGPEMDFRCFVSPKYELLRADEIFGPRRLKRINPNLPYLVGVGPKKFVRPRRQALDFAVGLLLKTRMPKSANVLDKNQKTAKPDPEELAVLERNVLLISKHLGLLDTALNFAKSERWDSTKEYRREPLLRWFQLANRIQLMFDPIKRKTAEHFAPNKKKKKPTNPLASWECISPRPGR
jgi:hypothetical protein